MRKHYLKGILLAVAVSHLSAVLPASGQEIAGKGKVTVASHEIEMKAGNLYFIKIEGKGFVPRVRMTPGNLGFGPQDFNQPHRFVSHYLANQDEKNTLFILPELFGLKEKGPFDYEYEVKPLALAKKPLLDEKDELVAGDMPFKAEFANRSHHKAYAIKLKAKQFYIIDMRTPMGGSDLDHYLYLVDGKGKIVAFDDDGGGFPNARIVYQAPADGDFRIIATGLGQALGKYVLTVRTTK